jgi:hypothetical protein
MTYTFMGTGAAVLAPFTDSNDVNPVCGHHGAHGATHVPRA